MILRVLIGAIALFVCLSTSANAATLNVVGGQLFGASDVLVDGEFYDVEFVDGTCIDLFTGCDDVSDFVFTDAPSAVLASQALLDEVFIDGPDSFDSDPELTFGCSQLAHCTTVTPYALSPGSFVGSRAINEADERGDGIGTLILSSGADLSIEILYTWAVWTPVPEPGTATLMALGLVGIAAARRRGTA